MLETHRIFGTSQIDWLQTKTGDGTHCLRSTHIPSPPSKKATSTSELTASDASPCAVLRRRSQSRQTSRSRKRPATLVPICNRTSAAAFIAASGSKAFGGVPSTTASVQGKRFPKSPSQDETGGRPRQRPSRCSRCFQSCGPSMSCSGI